MLFSHLWKKPLTIEENFTTVSYISGKQVMKNLFRFSKFGQIRKKMRTGQQKSLFMERAAGIFTIVWVKAKKTLNLVKL